MRVESECFVEGFGRLIFTKEYSSQHLIIISEKDMFDFSGGEPDPGMLTVLRALEVSALLLAYCVAVS